MDTIRAMLEEHKLIVICRGVYGDTLLKTCLLYTSARILQPRCDILTSIPESLDFIDELPEYDNAMYIHKKMKTTYEIAYKALQATQSALSELNDWSSEENLHELLLSLPCLLYTSRCV